MQPDQYRQLRELFVAAVATRAEERQGFLRAVARDHPDLHGELGALLAEHERTGAFLEAPAAAATAEPAPPERIGPYRILRVLGEGGMGVVYLAEQEQPRRRVALKVVRPGFATPRTLRRFEHEMQALARLRHPGIAQIYDAGQADTGRGPQPFFAMELVEGRPLLEFAESRGLGVRQRLTLLEHVCDAVHHAHQKGVIHCDLKPSNILVDEAGRPKVLDFGVARVTDVEVRVTTALTGVGTLAGTPAYMSPEQTLADPDQMDIRSDVYALGVVGYELLTGALPYEVAGRNLLEAVRVIREDEPTPLSRFGRIFRGDLDTMLRKALSKDRTRRYQAASELAADLRRYLEDEPITARPPSALYQLRKFAARNRALVAGVAVALLAVVLGAGGLAVGILRARTAESRAVRAADYLERRIFATNPWDRGEEARLPELLEQASADVEATFADDPETRARLHFALGRALSGAGRLEAAEQALRRSLAGRRAFLGAEHPDTLDSAHELADLLGRRGALDEARALFRELAETGARVLGEDQLLTLTARHGLATLQRDSGDLAQAEPALRALVTAAARALGDDHGFVALTREALAKCHFEMGRLQEAEASMRALVGYAERNWPGEHPRRLSTLQAHATCLERLGRHEEAEAVFREVLPLCRRVLGPDHMTTAAVLDGLGRSLLGRGALQPAEALFRKALEARLGKLGERHQDTIQSRNNLAMVLYRTHRLAEAEQLFRQVLAVAPAVLGESHQDVLMLRSNLAALLLDKHEFGAAEQLIRASLAEQARNLGEEHPATLATMAHLAGLFDRLDRDVEAEALFRVIAERSVRALGATHDNTLRARNNLAMALLSLGRVDEAVALLQELLVLAQQHRGEDDPITVTQRSNLGTAFLRAKRWTEAEPLLRLAVADRQRLMGERDPAILWPLQNLCLALERQGKRAAADESIDLALATWAGARDGPLPPPARTGMMELARLMVETGRAARAEPLLAELAAFVEAQPAVSWTRDFVVCLKTRAACLCRLERVDEAEQMLLRAWSHVEPALDAGDARTRELLRGLALFYEQRGQPETAARYRALIPQPESRDATR